MKLPFLIFAVLAMGENSTDVPATDVPANSTGAPANSTDVPAGCLTDADCDSFHPICNITAGDCICLTDADCTEYFVCDKTTSQGCTRKRYCNDDSDCSGKGTCDIGPGVCYYHESCFPGTGRIGLPDGSTKTMDQLRVGDSVHVGNGVFSEVFYFSTQLKDTQANFWEISTQHATLKLTPGHFLFVIENEQTKFTKAKDVKVGTTLRLGNGTQTVVTAVTQIWAQGLYNPHTLHGDIVVDDVLASTYTEAVHPQLAHALLYPLRVLYLANISFGQNFNIFSKGLPAWVRELVEV